MVRYSNSVYPGANGRPTGYGNPTDLQAQAVSGALNGGMATGGLDAQATDAALGAPPGGAPSPPPGYGVQDNQSDYGSGQFNFASGQSNTASDEGRGPQDERPRDERSQQEEPPPGPATGQPGPGPGTGTPPADTSERDKAVGDWWNTMPADPLEAYKAAYRHFLGREIDQETLDRYIANPQGLLQLVNGIYDSEEGRNFRARGASAGGGGTNPGAFAGYSGPFQGEYYTGFDLNRARNTDASAKDTFLEASGPHAGDQRWRTKAGAQAWFTEHIQPALEAKGYTVHQVVGDKAFVSTRENPNGSWIDFVVGADGDNPMLGWQDESVGGGMPGGGGAGPGGGPGGANGGGGGGGNTPHALGLALSHPVPSFSMLDYLLQAAATNKLFDPNSNLMLGGRR